MSFQNNVNVLKSSGFQNVDQIVDCYNWTPEQVQAIKPGLNIISEAARQYKTKQVLNNMKAAAVQSIMNPKDFTKFVKFMEALDTNVDLRVGVYPTAPAPDNKPPNEGDADVSTDEEDSVEAAESALVPMAGLSSALADASISNEPPTTQVLAVTAVASGGTVRFHPVHMNGGSAGPHHTHKFVASFQPIELYQALMKNSNFTAQAVVHVQANVRYDQTNIPAFQQLVISVGDHDFIVYVQLTLKGSGEEETKECIDCCAVSGGKLEGCDTCQLFHWDGKGYVRNDVPDGCGGGAAPGPKYNYLAIGLNNIEFRGMNGSGGHTRESLQFISQLAHMKDQAKKLGIKEVTNVKFVEHNWGSTTEGEVMFFNITEKQRDEIVADFTFDIGPYFGGEEVTPQFNIAGNGKMLPGCVSVVAEKSDTLRVILQGKNLSVPEDCMVLGFGVPVGFNVDTAFGDVVTKDMTFQLVVRLRGGAPVTIYPEESSDEEEEEGGGAAAAPAPTPTAAPAPVPDAMLASLMKEVEELEEEAKRHGVFDSDDESTKMDEVEDKDDTFRGATQLVLPDPAEVAAGNIEFSVFLQDTTDRHHVLAMWEGQHFYLRSTTKSLVEGMRKCLTASSTNQRGLYEDQLRKMVNALRLYGEDLQSAAASLGCSVTEMAQAFFGYITQLWVIKALPADENHGFFLVDRR